METEKIKLSKPYPFMKVKKDGTDLVISVLSFYRRYKNFFYHTQINDR